MRFMQGEQHNCSAEMSSATTLDLLAQLYASERREFTRLAIRITRCRAEAEDAVQLAFLNALARVQTLSSTTLRGWLRIVVRHLAIDAVRRSTRWRSSSIDVETLGSAVIVPGECTGISWVEVAVALRSAQPVIRTAFQLWYEGASYEEIAGRIGAPVATVGSHIYRAKLCLQKYYRRQELGNMRMEGKQRSSVAINSSSRTYNLQQGRASSGSALHETS